MTNDQFFEVELQVSNLIAVLTLEQVQMLCVLLTRRVELVIEQEVKA